MEAHVGSWANLREIFGRQGCTGTGFSLSLLLHKYFIPISMLTIHLSKGQVGEACEISNKAVLPWLS
jgi:hypothetical protein